MRTDLGLELNFDMWGVLVVDLGIINGVILVDYCMRCIKAGGLSTIVADNDRRYD